MIRHYFDFITNGEGMREIDEPVGFDSAGFSIKQDEGRKGRDVVFSGSGEAKLTITPYQRHEFERILMYFEVYGYEANVKYKCDFGEGIVVIGNIDFYEGFVTDQVEKIEFTVIQENEQAIYKRRYETNINCFSDETLDGQPIAPLQTIKVLLPAKPIISISEWKTPDGGGQSVTLAGLGGEGNNIFKYFNFANVTEQYDIDDSLSYISGNGDADDFVYLEAKDTLVDVKVDITNLHYKLAGTGNGYGALSLRWFVGLPGDLGGTALFFDALNDDDFIENTNQSYTINIPLINRNERLYIWFRSFAQSDTNFDTFGLVSTIETMNVKIVATSVAYDTVVDMVRLIDVMKYVTKSSSNLDIVAPEFDFGGTYYDQFVTTSNLMRGLLDKPFDITSKELVEGLIMTECNGDYEITSNIDVFFGFYRDFYRNYQIASFERMQFEGYEKYINPKYACNTLRIGYKNYASQKENEEENTFDLVHGESQWALANKNVENTREALTGFIRDAFLAEQKRREAYDLSNTTATQDDDKKYIFDVVELSEIDRVKRQTSFLQHTIVGESPTVKLVLTNDRTFSWILIGVTVGILFYIESEFNEGQYIVYEVSETTVTLTPAGAGAISPSDGENTTYRFRIANGLTSLKARTYEGFTTVENIENGYNYVNLAYTVKRNTIRFFSEEIATNNLFRSSEDIKNTLYKNNPEAYTEGLGLSITEGEKFNVTNAILSPYMYKFTLVCSLSEYWAMQSLLRSERGFITTWDANNLPIKGYIKEAEWKPIESDEDTNGELEGSLDVVIEEKYVPAIMDILVDNTTFVINGEIAPSGFRFSTDNITGKISIFDATGKLLHVPVHYSRVRVNNGAEAETLQELISWLSPYDEN